MIIRNIDLNDLNDVSKFIAKYNCRYENFVAWLEDDSNVINKQILSLKPVSFEKSCIIAVVDNEIVGFLGFYAFEEQKTVRLLGPFIAKEYWNEYAEKMWNYLCTLIPKEYETAKIAFFDKNRQCKDFSEENNFVLYNAERTLYYIKDDYKRIKGKELDAKVVDYHDKYYKQIEKLHPKKAYFTAKQMVERIDENNVLVMCIDGEKLLGYLYYEIIPDINQCEICFVNVFEEYRGKGYGSMLIQNTLKKCFEEKKIEEINISVRVNNIEADKLYKRLGFKEKNIIYGYEKKIR